MIIGLSRLLLSSAGSRHSPAPSAGTPEVQRSSPHCLVDQLHPDSLHGVAGPSTMTANIDTAAMQTVPVQDFLNLRVGTLLDPAAPSDPDVPSKCIRTQPARGPPAEESDEAGHASWSSRSFPWDLPAIRPVKNTPPAIGIRRPSRSADPNVNVERGVEPSGRQQTAATVQSATSNLTIRSVGAVSASVDGFLAPTTTTARSPSSSLDVPAQKRPPSAPAVLRMSLPSVPHAFLPAEQAQPTVFGEPAPVNSETRAHTALYPLLI